MGGGRQLEKPQTGCDAVLSQRDTPRKVSDKLPSQVVRTTPLADVASKGRHLCALVEGTHKPNEPQGILSAYNVVKRPLVMYSEPMLLPVAAPGPPAPAASPDSEKRVRRKRETRAERSLASGTVTNASINALPKYELSCKDFKRSRQTGGGGGERQEERGGGNLKGSCYFVGGGLRLQLELAAPRVSTLFACSNAHDMARVRRRVVGRT